MALNVRSREHFFQVMYYTPYRRSSPIKGRLLQRLSSVKSCLLSKVIFRQRSSSVKGRLPSKVIFCQRSSSVKCRLPSKVIFRQRSSSVKGCLLSKVVFRHRSSSVLVVSYVLTINGAHESSKINLKIEFFHKDSLENNI